MRTGKWVLFAVSAVLVLLAENASAQVADRKQIQTPALHEFHPAVPVRVQLANGLVILLIEDRDFPIVRGTALVQGGARNQPGEKAGLVEIFGQAWRTGGTKDKTGDQLDDYLEAHAATVETSATDEYIAVSMDCLRQNLDEVWQVFVDVLLHPEFRQEKVELAKNQINAGIARRNDSPFEIAFREASRLVYGADKPYGRVPEYATVARVSRQDLVDWHKKYVQPNNIVLGLAGDFDAKEMEAKLRASLESWPKGSQAPKFQMEFHSPKPGVYFIEKGDVTASTVQMVDLGTTRNNPDYYAIEVFNHFFGQGLSSRLFSNIRSKKGLAYSVGGGINTANDHPGTTGLFLGTKLKTTAAAIDAFYEELEGLQKHPCTAEELQKAKDALLNSFVFRFDNRGKILWQRMQYEFYGYPADFLERYRSGVEKVTLADVTRVAQKYLQKDKLAILVVGKSAEFDRPLKSFGPVTAIDITIPPPPGQK
jgi:zinc protease